MYIYGTWEAKARGLQVLGQLKKLEEEFGGSSVLESMCI